jgi:3-isopropylmalate dehydrogenase
MLADNCAMQLVKAPRQFDVILTDNLFGDILSDQAAMLTGSLGMLASASLGFPGSPGLYEPIHGSAPDIAGQNRANPCGMILSLALAFRYSLERPDLGERLEQATARTLAAGIRTRDLGGSATTQEVGAAITMALERGV